MSVSVRRTLGRIALALLALLAVGILFRPRRVPVPPADNGSAGYYARLTAEGRSQFAQRMWRARMHGQPYPGTEAWQQAEAKKKAKKQAQEANPKPAKKQP